MSRFASPAGLIAAGLVAEFDAQTGARLAPGRDVPAVAEWLVGRGFRIEQLGPVAHTLEDFYLQLTRDDLAGAAKERR